MIRVAVKSTNIAALGYSEPDMLLEVQFKPNRKDEAFVWAYEGVSAELFETLRTANEKKLSVGSIFHHQVRDRFKSRKVAVIIGGVEREIGSASLGEGS